MSAAFTPGPWKVFPDGVEITSVNGWLIATVPDFDEIPVAKSNARLIAAAPELYEALDELLHALHPATQRIAAAKARDALAKARGQ